MDNLRSSRGSQIRRSIPLNPSDPNSVAALCVAVGYDHGSIVDALVERCSVDRQTAGRIVADEALRLNQGGQ